MATIEEINALYESVFKRPADTAGAEYWAGTGASLPEIQQALASSPEAIVRNTYQQVFNRPGDTAGVEYWTNALASGQVSPDALAAAFRASTEGQGLLGGGTTGGTTTGTTGNVSSNANTGGLLGGTTKTGIPRDQGTQLITDLYRSTFDRAPDQAGLDYWLNLLTSGQQTWDEVRANILRSNEAATPGSQAAQAGIRQVQFGQQPIMGQVRDVANYGAQQNLPPSIQNAFQQSLAYQAALPWMIPQFNPADIPATYQQIAAPRQRLDISNITVPQWLQDAAKRDQASAAKEDTNTNINEENTYRGTGGITSTTPGSGGTVGGMTGGTVGGTTGGRSAADLQAFNTLLNQTYQTALGRPAETAGANYWTGMYTSGTPFQTIVNAIMNSPEAQARMGVTSPVVDTGGLLGGSDF
jgi:hypothetical protein